MDQHFNAYFREFTGDTPSGNFHKVIALHESDLSWREVKEMAPDLPKGWYELSRLSREERLEFIEQFWESKFIEFPDFGHFLESFFKDVEEIGIYITQKTYDDPFESQLVYCLSDNLGFFRGHPPAKESEIQALKNLFPAAVFPQDYLAFMQVHDGFHKSTDATGITPIDKMGESYEAFQAFFEPNDMLYTKNKLAIDPSRLIPFYTSFGMPFFQCFYMDWYPESEMGSVYCSISTKTVSDMTVSNEALSKGESLSFPYFHEWLKFYLEKIE